jgi:hypothetical protein
MGVRLSNSGKIQRMRPANPRIGGTSFSMRLNETYSQNIFISEVGKEKMLKFSKVYEAKSLSTAVSGP